MNERAPSSLLTAADVARLLNVSVRTVRRLIASGALQVVHLGRSVRIRPSDVAELTAGNSSGQNPQISAPREKGPA